jgi:hypothetical protein
MTRTRRHRTTHKRQMTAEISLGTNEFHGTVTGEFKVEQSKNGSKSRLKL